MANAFTKTTVLFSYGEVKRNWATSGGQKQGKKRMIRLLMQGMTVQLPTPVR